MSSAVTAVWLMGGEVGGQLPRLAPPAPCRVPANASIPELLPVAQRAARDTRVSIAVLPFDREIENASRWHAAWGLQDRVTRELARNPRLNVISAGTVARALHRSGGLVDSAGSLLGVRYLLTGKVTEAQRQQSVVAALYVRDRSAPVWRGSFSSVWTLRRMEAAIVSAVERGVFGDVEESRPARRQTTDGAYDALVLGDVYLLSPSVAAADSARMAYERALQLDRQSPVAALRVARAIVVLLERGGQISSHKPEASLNRATALAMQALRADSTLSEGWTILAMVARLRDPVQFAGATAAHVRAIRAAPNDPDVEHEFGITLMRLGDDRAAETHFRRALALEPNRANTLAAIAELALRAKRWTEACAASNASVEVWGFDPLPYSVRARARLKLAQARDAFADAETAARLTTSAWVSALNVLIEAGGNNIEMARRQSLPLAARWLQPGQSLSPRDASFLALAFAAVGDKRRTVESIRRARPVGADLATALRDDAFAPYRSDTAVVRVLGQATARPRR